MLIKLKNLFYLSFFLVIHIFDTSELKSDDIVANEFVKISLISSVSSVDDLDKFTLGLKFDLKPGWKVYWRSPGDAGLPTSFSVTNPKIQELSSKILFPVPERFTIFGIQTYGYSDLVVFPLIIKRKNKSEPLILEGKVKSLICSDICIPVEGKLSINLINGNSSSSLNAHQIAFFKSKVPSKGTGPNLKLKKITYLEKEKALNVNIDLGNNNLKDIIVETKLAGISFGKPKKINEFNYLIPVYHNNNEILEKEKITITVITFDEFREFVSLIYKDSRLKKSERLKIWFFMIAFLGGLILNLMPCVLPVLCLKLTSIILNPIPDFYIIRRKLLSSAFGILTSFFLLAGLLILLKFLGFQIGWGIQFQSPIFLVFMVLLIYFFMLNILNKFTIPVPSFASKVSTISDFSSGFMATLLATPCSAPLVGTAISFAFSGSYSDMLITLMFMGLGLSLPWVVLSVSPKLIYFLPKPGDWLERLKQLLSLGLLFTIIWLLYLLTKISGMTVSLTIISFLLIISYIIFIKESFLIILKNKRTYLFLSLVSIMIITEIKMSYENLLKFNDNDNWEQWSQNRLNILRENQRIIFVDVTADWCITCKFNKELVIESKKLKSEFKEINAVLLKADWTSKDPKILEYLIQNNRFGIPFNVIYGPGEPNGILLPEILNIDGVIKALKKVNQKQKF